MSRSNYDKPFYVDVGTSIVSIRCASNHDIVVRYDYVLHPHTLKLAEEICDRMNREVAIGKEEDAKYEYEIQGKYEGKWLTEAKNFSSINEAKVNRPAEWEAVE